MLKCWNHSTTTRNYSVTYYKPQKRLLEVEKTQKMTIIFKKLKIAKIGIKMRVFSDIAKIGIKLRVFSDRLFVSSHRGVDGEERWQQWGGVQQRVEGAIVGGGGGGGSTVGVSSTSKNRPSHHKYKSPKQFELKSSKSI